MRIVSVVGTRPQLIKAAALWPVLRSHHDEVFVDTGQHYDERLAGAFFAELGLPAPDHSLGIGGGTAAEQLGRMLPAVATVLTDERPDAVLVYGDTNSSLAGALAATTVGIPVAHVEAGLRSFDRRMPEETNRILADHLSAWLFAPTPTAVANLAAEGVTAGVSLVGDVMQDLVARVLDDVRDPAILDRIASELRVRAGDGGLDGPAPTLTPGGFLYATIHRAENRAPAAVRSWAALLDRLALPDRPVVLAIHPGTRQALEREGLVRADAVHVVEPLGYATSLALQLHAAAVLTDSGGIQREAGWLGVPCLVLRTTTEWVETLAGSGGRMVVVGLDGDRAATELARLAPTGRAAAHAIARARDVKVPSAGAAEAIARALAAGPPGGRPG